MNYYCNLVLLGCITNCLYGWFLFSSVEIDVTHRKIVEIESFKWSKFLIEETIVNIKLTNSEEIKDDLVSIKFFSILNLHLNAMIIRQIITAICIHPFSSENSKFTFGLFSEFMVFICSHR